MIRMFEQGLMGTGRELTHYKQRLRWNALEMWQAGGGMDHINVETGGV